MNLKTVEIVTEWVN